VKVAGAVTPPGDKSITHRALVLGALASGTSEVCRPLTSLDARSMAGVLRALGAGIGPLRADHRVGIKGRGLGGLVRPRGSLDCGNSGTAARFTLGVLSGHPFSARVTGDASLRRRPMRRVTEPLSAMGARFEEENGDGLPLVVRGGPLKPLEHHSRAASAQVKGALLLAGLVGGVPVAVHEPGQSRDHTERMLRALGVQVQTSGDAVRLIPAASIPGFEISIPGDPSSAAFLIAAVLLAERGQVEFPNVLINPTRTGFLRVIERMGATVTVTATGETLGEPVGTLIAQPAPLRAVDVRPEEVPALIDEIPILAVLAGRADGESVFRGVAELRVKESDRLKLMADNLRAVGIDAESSADTLWVRGSQAPPRGPVETAKDHRLAMAFSVLHTVPGADITLSERRSVAVSYPAFFDDLRRIRARG